MAPLAEVEELLTQLDEAQHRCSALQKKIDLLLTDRTATEKKAIELMTRLCEDQKRRYEMEIDSLKAAIENHKVEKLQCERISTSNVVRAGNFEKEVARLRAELTHSTQTLDDLKDQMSKEVHEEVGALRATNAHLQERINTVNEENEKLRQELAAEQERKDKLIEELENFKSLIAENERSSSEALKQLCNEISDVKIQKADLRCRFLEAQREILRLKTDRVHSQDDPSKGEIERLQRNLSESQENFEGNRRQLKEARDEAARLQQQLDRCRSENEILRHDYDEVRRELDDKGVEDHSKIEHLEKELSGMKLQNTVLKAVGKDLDVQCEDLQKLHTKYKMKNELLSDENQQLHVSLQRNQLDQDKFRIVLEKLKKENSKNESSAKYWQDEVHNIEKDYKDELLNLGRLIASEKGISLDYVKQLEQIKDSRREFDSQSHMAEKLLHDAKKDLHLLEEEKQMFEEKMTAKIADLEDKHREKEKKAKKLLEDTMDLGERYKNEANQFKSENETLASAAQTQELEMMKMSATILQYQKLNTHLQTQLSNFPKRGCFMCPDKKAPNPNALTPERMEELLAEYRQQNVDLSSMVRTLQASLKDERSKFNEANRKPRQRLEIVGRDLAIIKKTSSLSSDISTGSSCGEGKMRHNIPHRWAKHFVTKRAKCMACMEDLSFSSQCAKCEACKTTVHHRCAETLMNTCGLPMLYSDRFFEEERRLQESVCTARMNGWVKLWSSGSDFWTDAWACLENGLVSFYQCASDASHKSDAFAKIDLKLCTWKIHLRSGVDKSDVVNVPSCELPFVIEIKINAEESGVQRYYMVMPDLISKQRWLAAFQKAIPTSGASNQIHF